MDFATFMGIWILMSFTLTIILHKLMNYKQTLIDPRHKTNVINIMSRYITIQSPIVLSLYYHL